jgi:hypothetical protein
MDRADVVRDAVQAAEALAGLADRLALGGRGVGDDRVSRALAEQGSAAAERVLAYLRLQRGPGDGAATVVPTRLAPWLYWCPPRGYLLRDADEQMSRRAHGDPGE